MSNWKNKDSVLKAIYMEDYIPDVMEKIDPSLLADRDVIQYAICIDGCSLEMQVMNLKMIKRLWCWLFSKMDQHFATQVII